MLKAANTYRGAEGRPQRCQKEGEASQEGGGCRHPTKEREADDGSEQNVLNGRVGDHFLPFVLDSGAHITVVPAEVVDEELISNETILIRYRNVGRQKSC